MVGGLQIARVFGIPIYLHATWFIVFFLVSWLLSAQLAALHPDWAGPTSLAAAMATALLFFVSILLHELGHSVLALRHRVPVRSITLFVFGGVAVMEREPESPRAELEIAIAGPVVSALLALVFTLIARNVAADSVQAALAEWLARGNFAIAVLNLLPGFPLDGGRVLRAFLWARFGDAARATRAAAAAGQWLAFAFIAFGALQVLGGQLGGLWIAFIGWFLLSASGASLEQAALDATLQGLRARDVMNPDVARISRGASVAQFARELVMRGRRWALVEEAGRAVGLVSLTDVRRVESDAWESTPVGQIATPIVDVVTAEPDTTVREVLRTMATRGVNQIPIRDGERILGAVTRETLVQAIELRRGRPVRTAS
jgi:Zn-dependent protease